MPRTILLLLSYYVLLTLLPACYEDVVDCTDPDAANYDLSADEGCGDCCVYPTLSLEVRRSFGAAPLQLDSTYTDGSGNAFTLTAFRYYLGDIALTAGDRSLDLPTDLQEVEFTSGTDTVAAELNVNAILVTTEGSTNYPVGTLPIGEPDLASLDLSFGLPDVFTAVLPASAPTDSPLRTQPRLLNFRDGRGYVQSRVEYVLAATGEARSVSTFGYLPVSLPIPAGVLPPPRGDNFTLTLEADYAAVLQSVDLTADSAAVAADIGGSLPALLRVQ